MLRLEDERRTRRSRSRGALPSRSASRVEPSSLRVDAADRRSRGGTPARTGLQRGGPRPPAIFDRLPRVGSSTSAMPFVVLEHRPLLDRPALALQLFRMSTVEAAPHEFPGAADHLSMASGKARSGPGHL